MPRSSTRSASVRLICAALVAAYAPAGGQRAMADDRRDVDDHAAPLPDHHRHRGAAPVDGAEVVHLHEPLVGLRRCRGHGPAHAVPGVVHQDVEAAVAVDRGADEGFHLVALGNVEGHRQRLAAARPHGRPPAPPGDPRAAPRRRCARPRAAKASAHSRPMPAEAPVMATTLPARFNARPRPGAGGPRLPRPLPMKRARIWRSAGGSTARSHCTWYVKPLRSRDITKHALTGAASSSGLPSSPRAKATTASGRMHSRVRKVRASARSSTRAASRGRRVTGWPMITLHRRPREPRGDRGRRSRPRPRPRCGPVLLRTRKE